MNEKIIIILVIVAIILSILSIALTMSFDTTRVFSSNAIIKESGSESAGVGLVVQGTKANTNG